MHLEFCENTIQIIAHCLGRETERHPDCVSNPELDGVERMVVPTEIRARSQLSRRVPSERD